MPLKLRILTLTSLLAVLCSSVSAVVLDRIVAIVNNEAITERDVALAMRRPAGAGQKKVAVMNRKEALEDLIQEKLMSQSMGKSNIAVNEEDLNRAMRNVMAQYGMRSTDQLRAEVTKQGLSFDQYRENLKRHIQQIKFVNQQIGSQIKISDQDLEDYYQQHMKKFGGTTAVHIAEIVFPIHERMTEVEGRALEAKVKDVAGKLNRSNFRQMAAKYSQGPNATQGGDLGVVNPKSLPPEIASAITSMRGGDISAPIVTKSAIAIVMVVERSEATTKDFERLKDQIYNILYDQRMQDAIKAYTAQLRQNAYVQVNE